jgi:hypothetical protein
MRSGPQERFQHSSSWRKQIRFRDLAAPPPLIAEQHPRQVTGLVSRLMRLLEATPIDLGSLSEEIHSQPRLRSMVIGLSVSLQLSPASVAITLEEAAVALGAYRLRVMVYLWSMRPEDCCVATFEKPMSDPTAVPGEHQEEARSRFAGPTVETLYLDSFLKFLGLDSLSPLTSGTNAPCFGWGMQRAQFADLRTTMMRDFLVMGALVTDRHPHGRRSGYFGA